MHSTRQRYDVPHLENKVIHIQYLIRVKHPGILTFRADMKPLTAVDFIKRLKQPHNGFDTRFVYKAPVTPGYRPAIGEKAGEVMVLCRNDATVIPDKSFQVIFDATAEEKI
jgi:hypothetical protein